MTDTEKQYAWAFERTRQLFLDFIRQFPDRGDLSLCAYTIFCYSGSVVKAAEGMERVMEHLEVIKSHPEPDRDDNH